LNNELNCGLKCERVEFAKLKISYSEKVKIFLCDADKKIDNNHRDDSS